MAPKYRWYVRHERAGAWPLFTSTTRRANVAAAVARAQARYPGRAVRVDENVGGELVERERHEPLAATRAAA